MECCSPARCCSEVSGTDSNQTVILRSASTFLLTRLVFNMRSCLSREIPLMPSFCEAGIYRGELPTSPLCSPTKTSLSPKWLHCLLSTSRLPAAEIMDITIQHPWFKRALGPLIPSRLFDQFFGEGLFDYDLLPLFSSTISPYYRQSLFRTVLESGVSEVRFLFLNILNLFYRVILVVI